jgi:2-polyprenyl-3-methyl-5-hydroxy-6-metoxy-1,4-benzoquinol methylase
LRYLTHAVGESALDIGTGAGFYGRALQECGFSVQGVDLNPQDSLPFPVIQARLSDLSACSPADTVLLFDVLEHEENESAALKELRRLTKERLLLSVPNADRVLLTRHNLTYKHHIDKTHYREYTANELCEKLEAAGFHVLQINGEGPVRPTVFAEFVRPRVFRPIIHLILHALHRLKILHNPRLMADLYVVAEPI